MARYVFRFQGDGQHIHNGVPIKKGEEFEINHDIRQKHPDGYERFELVEEDSQAQPSTDDSPDEQQPRSRLYVHHRGRGWYDVINEATGERVNEVTLRHDAAVKLAEE